MKTGLIKLYKRAALSQGGGYHRRVNRKLTSWKTKVAWINLWILSNSWLILNDHQFQSLIN